MTGAEKPGLMQTIEKIEESAGRLYEMYADRLPEHEEFWFGLTMEEADRAGAVMDLIGMFRSGRTSFHEESSPAEKAEKLLARLSDELEKAKHEKITFNDALQTALEIEKTLYENRFYRLFGGGTAGARSALELLDSTSTSLIRSLQTEIGHGHEI
jgi:hypothetical protein